MSLPLIVMDDALVDLIGRILTPQLQAAAACKPSSPSRLLVQSSMPLMGAVVGKLLDALESLAPWICCWEQQWQWFSTHESRFSPDFFDFKHFVWKWRSIATRTQCDLVEQVLCKTGLHNKDKFPEVVHSVATYQRTAGHLPKHRG